MKYTFPAIFEKDGDKIGVTIPDLPGCYTFGDNLADAIEMAEDAAAMVLASYEDEHRAVPASSDIGDHKTAGTVSLILADTDRWRRENDNRAVKKTLSIPSWLNARAEAAGINFSQVLQDALKKVVGTA